MTVTCALDVFSCLDGCGSVSRGWGGCWGKQGPELAGHRRPPYEPARRADTTIPPQGRKVAACHSLTFKTSPSRSTGSERTKGQPAMHRLAMPAKGCTNGCSKRGGGRKGPARRVAAAAWTTPSSASTTRELAPRSWEPASSAIPDGTRTPTGRAGGASTRRSTRPSSCSLIMFGTDRDGGWHDLPVCRCLACRGAGDGSPGREWTERPHWRRRNRCPGLPCSRTRRPRAYCGDADTARPGRTSLGWS